MPSTPFERRIADATEAVFGDSPMTQQVLDACDRYQADVANIQAGRGINALLLAIVGAKGQGKTWAVQQMIREPRVRSQLRSGDLIDDATTRLVWVGPVAPEGLDPQSEIYHPCPQEQLVAIGQPYVLLDTPGLTDANQQAAELAADALSLATVKLLVIARDQLRAASNLTIAKQIDGAVCIPIISSVEPEEMEQGIAIGPLAEDLRALRDQLTLMASQSTLAQEVLVPDFEITGDEAMAAQVFVSGVLDRFSDMGLTEQKIGNARERRLHSAMHRLRQQVQHLIQGELPQLSAAVSQLTRETEQLPERVLATLLGSEEVLQTGVRMRLRARLVSDTPLLWFPYRTVMSTLHLTQGAWDRVMLALAGSIPSLFGALSSWARNVRQNQAFSDELQSGIRKRTQQQVEERLQPLCNEFHRAVMNLRPREQRKRDASHSSAMRLSGIEELQTSSQEIFNKAIEAHATPAWQVQLYACLGTLIFWTLMAGPIVLIYREYFLASYHVFTGQESHLENFPHPTPGLFFTSLILSILPLAIYCMVVLTRTLSRRAVGRVAAQIALEHETAIRTLKADKVIRLDFEDELLQQAEFLINLQEH
ncbi:hypothetical protein [Aureliella helgolandensis]|uniref:Uncharacterized protein n=1 Tax=Aureliella helgolandensis TaxID=2527968 RepID=A0A518G219_9BACT|nr:hypothetical protein [Aureliella helgolandensis]QDV22585.1 hypothetical protein Q31a_08710 [Aureliella helgolandensis]